MNKLKTSLTCSYCSKIFHDPIELPYSHNLCQSHLVEKKEKQIECAEFKKEFQINDNEFRSNTFIRKQIDDHVYLNDQQFSLKNKIEDSIRTFFQMFE